MVLSVSAGAANVLLDYVFMVPLQMGIRGSALGNKAVGGKRSCGHYDYDIYAVFADNFVHRIFYGCCARDQLIPETKTIKKKVFDGLGEHKLLL